MAEVPGADADRVREMVSAAVEAQVDWASLSGSDRAAVLFRVADLIERDANQIAELESRNTGKLLHDTRREATRAAGAFRYYAGWADKVAGRTFPLGDAFHAYSIAEPLGVIAGIIPWNVPFFFAAKKFAPALAFGNACLVKPAEETPLSAMRLEELMLEAGVPAGLAQVVTGGREAGASLVDDPRVELVVFTGHHETGKRIAAAAAQNLTPTVMELGGKNPHILFDDADLDAALLAVETGVFASCGQMCIAGTRLLLHDSIYDEAVARLSERVRGLRLGDALGDDTVDVGPQITHMQQQKTLQFIAEAAKVGTVVAQSEMPTDDRLSGGYFVPPTMLTDLPGDAEVLREEVFGPVLAVQRFSTDEEALAIANDSDFGLAAGVWTNNLARAHRMARELKVGTVWINTYRVLSEVVPFGGNKLSGYGRENGEEAVRLYTRPKSVWTGLEAGVPRAFVRGE